MERIYQLNIELKESHPKIWRRIQVSGDTTFSELHDIIQFSMGWEHDHLYEFILKKARIFDFEEAFDDGTNPLERDSTDTFLDEMVPRVKTKFTYVYDFGDNWEHEIQVEKIFPGEEGMTYPICIEGERACPPEDSGGIWGFQHKLEVMADESHPDHDDVLDWIGEDWDPELFSIERVNASLKNYMEQWEEIYDETEAMLEGLEEDEDFEETEDSFSDYDEEYTYSDLKKFASPEDVLRDVNARSEIEILFEVALQDDKSAEYIAYQRLRSSGIDAPRCKNLVLQALSIEWFYHLKYGIDYLKGRLQYNLNHLPDAPQEIPRLEDAVEVLNTVVKGIPFRAIEYIQNSDTAEARNAVLKELHNYSDHRYCWRNCKLTPFFYALAAEGHICEALIDPVIQMYGKNDKESDWLFDQGQYLIGKLAEKYPDKTAEKVLAAMEEDVNLKNIPSIFYLFDAFYFCDLEKYKPRLLALFEHDEIFWLDALAATVADLSIKEGIPVLEERLEKLKAHPEKDIRIQSGIIEVREAINILKGKITLTQEEIKPLSLKRGTDWQDDLLQEEQHFYESEEQIDDFDLPEYFEQGSNTSPQWPLFSAQAPIVNESLPGRNDPCHCGSGKKYKKCCMDKDG